MVMLPNINRFIFISVFVEGYVLNRFVIFIYCSIDSIAGLSFQRCTGSSYITLYKFNVFDFKQAMIFLTIRNLFI